MSSRVHVYLSDEAMVNLGQIQAYLSTISGIKVARSAAINALLVKGAGLYLADLGEVRRVVAKYVPKPEAGEVA